MCYTSGTTGRPKGVVYSHRSTVLHTLVGCLADHWGMRSDDVLMPVTPMFHANCWGVPYGAVMLGVKIVFPGPHLHPDDLLDLMQQEPPTLSLGVPTIWMTLIQAYERALAEQPGRWTLPQGMRSMVGGAAVPEALIRAYARHGVHIGQGWGMTETSPLATVSYERAELRDAGDDERFRRAAMAGVPVPLVDLRIRTDDGADAPWDGKTMGEIQVRGPFITGSYHEVPPTPDKFTADGWLRTGDVATMDALGFVRITDRTKDLIKSGGEWISSVDLENALMAHPAIAEAAVIALPRREVGRAAAGLHRAEGGAGGDAGAARRAPEAAWLRQVAAARSVRDARRDSAHVDRQVLEAEAARTLCPIAARAGGPLRLSAQAAPRRAPLHHQPRLPRFAADAGDPAGRV